MIYAFDDYEFDAARFELRHEGERVPMEPQVFEVLACLIANHDRAVSKDELIGHVWPDRFISDAALNSRVMAARKAIGDNGRDQRLIRTIHGRGYRFVGAVREVQDGRAPLAGEAQGEPPAAAPVPAAREGLPEIRPAGIDVPLTSFVGRDGELSRFEQVASRPGCRLITIAGPGGVGKTRLAVEAAHRLEQAGCEVVPVPVETDESVEDVICSIGARLGLALASGDPVELARRVGEREVLVLLDNVEHVAREAAPAIATMLHGAPRLRFVVTTREVLGLPEEWLFSIGGLGLERENGAPSEAARLFLEREAQAVGGAAGHGSADLETVEEICQLVDGMPLAIELAAALRRYLGRGDIARQIRADVEFLRADLRNVPLRHRSIPGLLAESFRRLSVEQMRALLSLAVFEGSFTADASAAVAEAPLRVLGELVDRSLVQPREGRFALHPLLRQFASDRLGPAYRELQERHATYFLERLASFRPALEGADQVAAAAAIEPEWANISSAWHFACVAGRVGLIEEAARSVYLFAHLRSRWLAVRHLIDAALAVVEAAAPEHWRLHVNLLMYRAWALMRTTRSVEVQALTERAAALLDAHAALATPGPGTDPVAVRSMIAWADGRYPLAAAHAERAVERAREHDDVLGEAFALWLHAVALVRGAPLVRTTSDLRTPLTFRPASEESVAVLNEARSKLERAAAMLSARGERWLLATIRVEQSGVAKCFGDVARARSYSAEALELRRAFDDARGMADALIQIADSHLDAFEADLAQQACDQAAKALERLGDLGVLAELQRALARVAWLRRDLDEAMRLLVECGELSMKVNAVNNVLAIHRGIGDVCMDREDYHAAAELHAFVAEHPASTAFSKALSEAALRHIAARISDEEVAAARARAATYNYHAFSRAVFAAVREGAPIAPADLALLVR
jgi:DNA-binding winged helix-turn-helix (wHTH) protein